MGDTHRRHRPWHFDLVRRRRHLARAADGSARRSGSRLLIAGFFNVAVFDVCSAYAQVYGTTSRAIVIAYSMPIWAALLARIVLKEQLTAVKLAALAYAPPA